MSERRQAWIVGQHRIEVRDAVLPSVGTGEVLVRSSHAGVCGSDLHTWHHGHSWLGYPICPGHEATGWVEACGDDVADLRPGDAVVLRPIVSCGTCFMCRRAQTNLCERLRAVGAHDPGAMADFFVAPATSLSRLPDAITMSAGAMVEPLSCVVHATNLVGGVEGRTVAVVGAGSIGLLATLNALASGAERVVVSDTIAAKLDLAVSLGAHGAVDAADPSAAAAVRSELGGRPDIVLDCVGSPTSVRASVEQAVPGGRVAVIGVCSGDTELPLGLLQDREVMVAGSAMYLPEDFDRALDLVAGGLAVERLVTRVVDLEDVADGFSAAASGGDVKVHVVAHTA